MAKSAITLASGREMPLVGFGLWKVPKETAAETVYNATDSSTAPTTTKTRKKLAGQGIQRAITEGLVTRAEIFVTTKLWNNYHRREHALRMAKRQSEAWGLGYIDLYLIHFPVALEYIDPAEREYPAWWMDDADKISPANIPISEAWTALEELVDSGIAKSIGVSNFQAQTLYDIKTYARHPISALQIEHHPYLVQGELIQMAQDNGIAVTAYSSFGPLSFVEWPPAFSKEAKGIELLFDAAPVKAVSERVGVSPARVLLRWATQRGIAVIPKSNNPTRLAGNLDTLGFDLTDGEIEGISALDRGLRFNDPGFYLADYPLRIFA